MDNKNGFGLVGLLITMAIILGLAGGLIYFFLNKTTETMLNPKGGDKSPIEEARDTRDLIEDRNQEIIDNL
jgi:uncharacterized membrane protein